MEESFKLNKIFHDVNSKLDQIIINMDKISSFILNYSTKVPLTSASDVYLIFNLRERISTLYKNVTECVSILRKKLSYDTHRVNNLQKKISSKETYRPSLDKLTMNKRLIEKRKEWKAVLENLDLNFVCKLNYSLAANSIMDSIESLTNNKKDHVHLTTSRFINQKVLYNGDSIQNVVEKILNLSKDKIKIEQEDTFIAKLMESLNAQIFIEKYKTETKLNEMLTILNKSKDQSVMSSELTNLLKEIQEKIHNLEKSIDKINLKPNAIMKSIDTRNSVLKKSFESTLKTNNTIYLAELKKHISDLKSNNSTILNKLNNNSDDEIYKINQLEDIITKMTKEFKSLPNNLISNIQNNFVEHMDSYEKEFVGELGNIRRKLQVVENISTNLEQYNTNYTETKDNLDNIMSELNDYIQNLTDTKSITQAIVTGVYGELFNTVSNIVSQHFENISNDQSIDLQYIIMKYITGIGQINDDTTNLKKSLNDMGYGANPKKIDDVILHFKDLRNNLHMSVDTNKLSINEATKKLETVLSDITKASKEISMASKPINRQINVKKRQLDLAIDTDTNSQRNIRQKILHPFEK